MQLDKKDRLIIANQLKILEKLYPEEATYYAQHRKALEYGYSLHYSWLVENFFEEMTVDECREVLEILNMYRAITFSYKKIQDTSGIQDSWLKFQGFDGNNESKQFSYAQYFISDLGRFDELKYEAEYPDFNSHMPTLEKYRRMLAWWNSHGRSFELSKNQLVELLGV
ncbi:MAG: YfbU family protein [Nitrospirales bacterium]|nr:YfbU family protein [Nitrospirales bacterium]